MFVEFKKKKKKKKKKEDLIVTVDPLNSDSNHLTYFNCCGLFKVLSLAETGIC